MNTEKIIPFGKYKGQPINVLENDLQYLDWLRNQDWFKENYQQFNTVIVNNFQEPSETPEHNRLQNLFLDDNFCLNFSMYYRKVFNLPTTYTFKESATIKNIDEKPKLFIPNGQSYVKIPSLKDIDNEVLNQLPTYKDITEKLVFSIYRGAIFEYENVDVWFVINSQEGNIDYKVEIKPSLGDDYPAVLRQMNNNKSKFLLIDTFSAIGANLEQVKDIFKRSGKVLFQLSEIR